jgi:hypothetical protein
MPRRGRLFYQRAIVSRYFFSVPAAGVIDQEETELGTIAAVLDEAIARAQEVPEDAVSSKDRSNWVLVATDESGRAVLSLRLTDAPRAFGKR